MPFQIPQEGLIFWPVGCGDSTTLIVDENTFIQIDLNHLSASELPATPIIDDLVEILPKKDGKPYLSVFVLTHPDLDHCRGFKEFLKKVTIGELWFSPRIFDEYKCDISEDAEAFQNEALARVTKLCKKQAEGLPACRIRIIGRHEILEQEPYKGLSKSCLTSPGEEITSIDGKDYTGIFRAFVHAPFKDDCSGGDRNDTSIALQLRLLKGEMVGNALLFGDLAYQTIRKIFEVTEDDSNLEWNVLLAPHHCSKKAMFWKEAGDDEEVLKQDVMDSFESTRLKPNWIVASCGPIPEKNESGDNPPHALAKEQYELITSEFHCTHEHVEEEKPHPVVFELTSNGLTYRRPEAKRTAKVNSLTAVISAASGQSSPPKARVGFGGI